MQELIKFREYWDCWHKEWYERLDTMHECPDWAFPKIGDIGMYFPEPYWGNPYVNEKNFVATFLNINPGSAGPCQKVNKTSAEKSILYEIYNQQESYSKCVEKLSKNTCYITTGWFENKRVKWLNELNETINLTKEKITVQNILCADLIPWHTDTVNSFVREYINSNKAKIISQILEPIRQISLHSKIKGVVIAKGKNIQEILQELFIEKPETFYRDNGSKKVQTLDVFCFSDNSKIMVFVGGQGMSLPKAGTMYRNSKDQVQLSEIIRRNIVR